MYNDELDNEILLKKKINKPDLYETKLGKFLRAHAINLR